MIQFKEFKRVLSDYEIDFINEKIQEWNKERAIYRWNYFFIKAYIYDLRLSD